MPDTEGIGLKNISLKSISLKGVALNGIGLKPASERRDRGHPPRLDPHHGEPGQDLCQGHQQQRGRPRRGTGDQVVAAELCDRRGAAVGRPVLESGARGHTHDPQGRGDRSGLGQGDSVRAALHTGGGATRGTQDRPGEDPHEVELDVVPLGREGPQVVRGRGGDGHHGQQCVARRLAGAADLRDHQEAQGDGDQVVGGRHGVERAAYAVAERRPVG
ncbi:hypothetical protein SSPO_026470 [Streptomyces antimycoticus]|uniref:Uncharacterized protein n=1 Tax=Streptomyces antimycoticus TaxID=68175 RepID=A0A499USN5_9ACTN|nr:hypothetical protein [Streptomyces antimycoticus]BBJ39929.1 hypothetical protein SSPO_026470 [Streptomyces antimycoticus]